MIYKQDDSKESPSHMEMTNLTPINDQEKFEQRRDSAGVSTIRRSNDGLRKSIEQLPSAIDQQREKRKSGVYKYYNSIESDNK